MTDTANTDTRTMAERLDVNMHTHGVTVRYALSRYIGLEVGVEGTFPIPMPNGQVAYAPARGVLTAVYEGGFDLLEKGEEYPTVFNLQNVRSVLPVSEKAKTKKPGGIITPGF